MQIKKPKPALVYAHKGIDAELVRNLLNIGYPLSGIVLAADVPASAVPGDIKKILVAPEVAYHALDSGVVADLIVSDPSVDDGAAQMAAYHAANKFAPKPTRLLHPAATIPYFGVRYPGLYACIGFPGSGNIVIQAVLNELQVVGGVRHNLGHEPFCTRMARNSAFLLQSFLDEALEPLGPCEKNIGHDASLCAEARLAYPGGKYLNLKEVPYCGWIGQNFGGHTLMTPSIKQTIEYFGYTFVLAMRDPINALVSVASKTTRPAEFALNDASWHNQIYKLAKHFYRCARLIEPVAHQVRYENLLADPVQEIAKCARFLQVKANKKIYAEIWDKVGMKPLTPAGTEHFFDPMSDKTKHLSQEILDKMEESGIRRISDHYDYKWPNRDRLPLTNRSTDERAVIRISELHGVITPSRESDLGAGIICQSNDGELLKRSEGLLSSEKYRRYYPMLGTFSQAEQPSLTGK